MNIKTLSSMLDQQLRIESKVSGKTGENVENEFSQLLQISTAKTDEQSPQQADVITANAGAVWLQLLLTPFGQHLDEKLLTPDLALSLNSGEKEEGSAEEMIPASLTEIMAALQPLISQSNVPLLTQSPISSDEMTHLNLTVTNDTGKANTINLLELLNTMPQGENVLASTNDSEQLLNTTDTLFTQAQLDVVATGNASNNPIRSQKAVKDGLNTAQTMDLLASPNVNVTNSKVGAANVNESQFNDQVNHNKLSATGEQLPQGQISTVTERSAQPQPQISTSTELPPIVPQTGITPVTTTLSGPQPAVESASTFHLPNIPALHQITDSIGILSQQGQTEVRLHLQPETLGHLWVQLHIVDGNVAVQMLAETPQAQALIQDHLAQLKMAFAAQGLQINGLSVAVGQDNPAFNLPGRRSNGGSNGTNRQSTRSSIYELEQTTDTRSTINLWGILRAVDYQV